MQGMTPEAVRSEVGPLRAPPRAAARDLYLHSPRLAATTEPPPTLVPPIPFAPRIPNLPSGLLPRQPQASPPADPPFPARMRCNLNATHTPTHVPPTPRPVPPVQVARGRAIIPANRKHLELEPTVIGEGTAGGLPTSAGPSPAIRCSSSSWA
jgi:hypothetical protein